MSKFLIVVGGGASGLMAAITAAKRDINVLIIEKMPRPLRKVMITGKGRCNLTNYTDLEGLVTNVSRNGKFLYSAFSAFSAFDTYAFFENAGVPLKIERGDRVFPVSDKAVDIVDALHNTAKKLGVKFCHTAAKKILTENGNITGVVTVDGVTHSADAVILATGGLSYPTTGSSGDGFLFAKELGHTVTKLRPALVPMNIHEGFCEILTGLSLKNVSLRIEREGKQIFSKQGEMLFTHFGISGPLVLTASSLEGIEKGEHKAYIDLKPALSIEQLDKRILRDFEEFKNKDIIHSLGKLLPSKLISVIISLAGINPHTKVNSLTKEQRFSLINTIKNMPLTITGLRPFEEAVITKGGVSVKEIDPKTMKSKLVSGLFFAGEIIDADAFTGGFNLQIAFSTGYLAGLNV